MDYPLYSPGQLVTINRLYSSEDWVERELESFTGRVGIVVKTWCRTKDEMPELSKSFVYPDVWCYDIRLDDGTVLPGVPEAALTPALPATS